MFPNKHLYIRHFAGALGAERITKRPFKFGHLLAKFVVFLAARRKPRKRIACVLFPKMAFETSAYAPVSVRTFASKMREVAKVLGHDGS